MYGWAKWCVLDLQGCGCGKDIFDVDPLGGIVAGVAGGAEAVALAAVAGFQQPFERKIGQRIGFDELANLFDADLLAAIRSLLLGVSTP